MCALITRCGSTHTRLVSSSSTQHVEITDTAEGLLTSGGSIPVQQGFPSFQENRDPGESRGRKENLENCI